jgi:hypothetical protein
MSREEREKILGVYLTIDTLNHEKNEYPRILRSEAHERWSNTSISGKPGNRLKGNTKWK